MNAFLVALPSGKRIDLLKNEIVVGRNTNSDIKLTNEHVSRRHCKISRKGLYFFISDLDSSNGTYLNGEKISTTVRLRNNDTISLGQKIAAFQFRRKIAEFDKWASLLKEPKFFIPFVAGIAVLSIVVVYLLVFMNAGKINIKPGIEYLKERYGETIIPNDPDFYSTLTKKVESMKTNPEFPQERSKMAVYKGIIEKILEANKLPLDFSFIPWAESGFNPLAMNQYTHAAGMWQLIPETARQYGLKVDSRIDERLDPIKATEAAALYLKDLVAEFGSDSFLIVLAAYNAGDGAIIYGLRQIEDPVNDRNYWYLSTHNLIPEETKKYVMTIFALIIANSDNNSE